MYKQKGTGNARHGARSAPLFVGGAKAMGPVAHSHEFDLPKKVKALGLRHALSAKAKDGAIVILDEAKSKEIKTGALAKQFGKLKIASALVVDGEFDKNFQLSARNLTEVALLPVSGINVYDIMRSDKLVLTTAAVKAIEARLSHDINYDVILSPVITEKATRLTEANQVVFRVTLDATKPAIAKAVADLFKVKVKAVNTVIVKGKRKLARGKPLYAQRFQESDRDPGRGPPDRHHDGSLSHGTETL